MQDRFVKIMLVVVAGLLVANLLQSQSSPSLLSSAQAQTSSSSSSSTNYKVRSLEGFTVEDLKDVVAVGDGRSFVVSNSKGFMVYQVLPR